MKKIFTIITLLTLMLAGCQKPTADKATQSSKDRPPLTASNQDLACEAGFNFDAANTTRNYTSEKFGISVDLPFNEKWGSEFFSVSPFEEVSNDTGVTAVSYGKMTTLTMYEDCSAAGREYSLLFIEPLSADAYITKLKENPELIGEPEIITINGLQVVKDESGGMGTYRELVVIGTKYNYVFTPSLFSGSSDFKELEEVVKTVKLL